MTLYPDKCDHGTETYVGTIYNKDIYALHPEDSLCIRHGKENEQYTSMDTSYIVDILHHGSTDCCQLKELVKKIVQQGE